MAFTLYIDMMIASTLKKKNQKNQKQTKSHLEKLRQSESRITSVPQYLVLTFSFVFDSRHSTF